MKNIFAFISALLITFSFSVNLIAQTPESLLPKDNDISGWTLDPDSICKTGIANDTTALYDIIDGGAEVYTGAGWVAGAFTGYTNSSEIICIEIYDQGKADSAFSVFMHFDPLKVPVANLGDHAHLDTGLATKYNLEFTVNKFFIRLRGPKTDPIKEALIDFAEVIVDKVPIIHELDLSSTLTNRAGAISAFPGNGSCMFKVSVRSNQSTESNTPALKIYNPKGSLIQTVSLQPFGATQFIGLWEWGNQREGAAKGIYTAILNHNGMLLKKNFVIGY